MARLPYVEKDRSTPEQQQILGQLTQKSGKIANMWKLWSHSPQTLETFMPFYKSVMKARLDGKLRELAYIQASLINDCAYCAGPHRALGLRLGLTEGQIREIPSYESSTAFSHLEKLVLRYSEQLTRHARTSDELMNELRQHLSEAELVELNLTVGVANLTNRFNMSFMTDTD